MPFEFGSQALLGLELLFRPETQEAAASLVSFCYPLLRTCAGRNDSTVAFCLGMTRLLTGQYLDQLARLLKH